MNPQPVTGFPLWRYSLLATPVAFAGYPLYVLAPDYYATEYGVSLSLLGGLLLGLRLLDAVQDPLIGALSDRYRHAASWFMGASAMLLCVAIYALFNAMPMSPAIWFALCMTLAVSAYSVLSINLNALGGIWGKDNAAQTNIASARESCGLIGLLAGVAFPGVLAQAVSQDQVYIYYSLILAALMALAWMMFMPWLNNMRLAPITVAHQRLSLSGMLRLVVPETRRFLLVYGISMLASSIPAVLVIFFVRDLLHAYHLIGIYLLLYFLTGALSMPFWRQASLRIGLYRTWLPAMLMAVAGFVWAWFLSAGDMFSYGIICVVSGFALGADIALPPAILANQLHKSQKQHEAAAHYALLAFVAKLGLALASAISLPLLGMAGFTPGTQNTAPALKALSSAYALIPCLLKLCAAAFLWQILTKSDDEPRITKPKDNL